MDAVGTANPREASNHGRRATRRWPGSPGWWGELEALAARECRAARAPGEIGGGLQGLDKCACSSRSSRGSTSDLGRRHRQIPSSRRPASPSARRSTSGVLDVASRLLEKLRARDTRSCCRRDCVVGKEFAPLRKRMVGRERGARDDMILDIGPDTADRCSALLQGRRHIIWKRPWGVFELRDNS